MCVHEAYKVSNRSGVNPDGVACSRIGPSAPPGELARASTPHFPPCPRTARHRLEATHESSRAAERNRLKA